MESTLISLEERLGYYCKSSFVITTHVKTVTGFQYVQYISRQIKDNLSKEYHEQRSNIIYSHEC